MVLEAEHSSSLGAPQHGVFHNQVESRCLHPLLSPTLPTLPSCFLDPLPVTHIVASSKPCYLFWNLGTEEVICFCILLSFKQSPWLKKLQGNGSLPQKTLHQIKKACIQVTRKKPSEVTTGYCSSDCLGEVTLCYNACPLFPTVSAGLMRDTTIISLRFGS